MPNRKHVADRSTEEDGKLTGANPGADLAPDGNRKQNPPGDRTQYAGDVVIEDVDPDEVDPGQKPRTPI